MKELTPFRQWLREQELKQEKIDNSFSVVLSEGIDIDLKNKIVEFNDKHENNVDTSTAYNPTEYKFKGIDVISIFKRKKSTISTDGDGNPLIYALKGLKDWKIDDKSITELFKNFISISKKIKPKYDTIISISSSSSLNTKFLYRLNKIIKSEKQITDLFSKLPANEILIQGDIDPKCSDKEFKIIQDRILEMIIKDNYFTYKTIPTNLRKYIVNSSVINGDDALKYSDSINDKDILILDDTISSGETISDNVKAIRDTFAPKSITVITLFSKL